MADLTDLQAAQTVKIVGSDASGVETNPVNATSDNRLQTENIIKGATDGTRIGNVGDRLKVDSTSVISAGTGTLTNRSGTVGTVSIQVMAVNTNRKYLFIQNVGNQTIWINFTAAATTTQPSIQMTPGASFVMENSFVSTEAINVISNNASVAFTAKEA